jgi:hypothetical protein
VTKKPKVALPVTKRNQSNEPQQTQLLRVPPVIALLATARRALLAIAPIPPVLKATALLAIGPTPHVPKVTAP